MTPGKAFINALHGQPVDRVPYFEYGLDPGVVQAVTGHPYDRANRKPTKRRLGICEVEFWRKPPVFVQVEGTMTGGRNYVGHGAIQRRDQLGELVLPPPAPAEVLEPAQRCVEEKDELASILVIALGLDPLLRTMGYDGFAYALADDPQLPVEILKRYIDWTLPVVEALLPLGFDCVLAGDDMAHKTAPFFSPAWFEDVAVPLLQPLAAAIDVPWILHCDGNVEPLFPGLFALGISGLNPIEPEAMDIFRLKRLYGDRLTLIGNIDINTLALGTPEQVRNEVRDKIGRLAPGGRYVISSSTSIPEYVKPENYRAMLDAIREFAAAPWPAVSGTR